MDKELVLTKATFDEATFAKAALTMALLMTMGLVACGSGATDPGPGIPEDAALKITGMVDAGIGWTEEAIRSMDTIEAEATNKEGEAKTYTGVPVSELLTKAGVKDGATTLVLVADDGSAAEVALAEVQACQDCIVSFRNKGGFSTVLPGFPGNAQVKGVVEIQVK